MLIPRRVTGSRPRKRVYIVRMGRITWTRTSLIRALHQVREVKQAFPGARVSLRSEMRDWYPRY